jgi:hypothetical protein
MASLFLSWCFDVLTKNLNSHLLTCHCLQITPRQPPTLSGRRIPSNTSSTRGRWNVKVRNRRQVYLPGTFDWLTLIFVYFCHTRWHPSKRPTDTTNTPSDPSIPSSTSLTRGKWNMEARCRGEVSRWGKSRTDAFDFSFQHLTSACWLLLLRKQAKRNNQLSQRTIAYTTIKTNKHTTINPRMKLCLRFEGLVSCLYCLLVKSIWINTHSDLFSLFSSSNRAKQVSYDFIITLKTNSINKTYTLFVLYSTSTAQVCCSLTIQPWFVQ